MVISPASLKLKIFYKRKKNAMTVFANLSMRRLKTNIRPSLTWQKLGWIFLAAGSQVVWLHTGDTGGVRLESEYQSGKEKHGSHWQLKRTLNRTSDSAKYLWIHPNWSQTDHKLGYIPQVKKSYLKELFAQEEVTSLFTI